jgi:prepilin peptidase CpaA
MITAMVPPLPPLMIEAVALALLAGAAARDVALRRIPNGIAAALALLGLLRHAGQGAGMVAAALLAAGAVLLAGVLLWQRGLTGGGDVKLLAAAALLVSPAAVPDLLLAVPVAGGALALAHLGLRRVLRPDGVRSRCMLRRILRCEARRIRRGAPLPYGVAIATGAAFVLTGPGG